jgi:hypothetical protein
MLKSSTEQTAGLGGPPLRNPEHAPSIPRVAFAAAAINPCGVELYLILTRYFRGKPKRACGNVGYIGCHLRTPAARVGMVHYINTSFYAVFRQTKHHQR